MRMMLMHRLIRLRASMGSNSTEDDGALRRRSSRSSVGSRADGDTLSKGIHSARIDPLGSDAAEDASHDQ